MFTKQCVVTLDLEGVLAPEIWIAVAEKTGIKDLRLTTRDIPDYDVLMKGRVQTMLRRSRGKDADAACGQLRLRHLGPQGPTAPKPGGF